MDSLHTTEPVIGSAEAAAEKNIVRTDGSRVLRLLQLPLLAVGSGGLLWLLLSQLPAWFGEMPYVGVSLQLMLLLYIGLMSWLFVRPYAPRTRTNGILLGLGLFFLAILTLKLKNTPFTIGGINGDTRFYTTYITKLANYPGYGDMFYKDLPSFYPPLYYFTVARAAEWVGVEPFRVMKYGLFVTVMALPLITGALWRRLVDERLAAAVALCMLVFPDWFKPNEWLALAAFVPWWLHWVDNIGGYQPQTRRDHLWWWLGGGLIGALIFQLYFFWLFVGGVTLLVRVGWWLVAERDNQTLRRSIVNAVSMLAVTALLSSPFWAPYLYSMFTTGGWEPLQNRWFSESKIPLPLVFLQNEWQALVYLGGLAYLILAATSDRVARGLLWLVAGFFVWVAIGYVGILAHMPLLTFRSYPVLTYLLGAGAFLGLFRLWHGDFVLRELVEAIFPWRRVATCLLLFVVVLFANDVIIELQTQENVQDAVAATYPAEELAMFDRLTNGDYENRVGLVTNSYRSILFFRPLYSFLAWSAHFSHPAGNFHSRAELLTKAAQVHDPALFATLMANNRYDPIDYFLLKPINAHWNYGFVDDNFPYRVVDREINFPQVLLAEPYFQARRAGEYTLLVQQELPTLVTDLRTLNTATVEALPPADVARLYLLLREFAGHVAWHGLSEAAQQSLADQLYRRLTGGDVHALPLETLLDLRETASGLLAAQVRAALATELSLADPVVFTDDTGRPLVTLLGYRLRPSAAGESRLNLYFSVVAPPPESFMIWVHIFDANGEKLIFDHNPSLSTTDWVAGQIYHDQATLTLAPGHYQLDVGFWEPDLDQRLWADGEPGVTLGQIQLPVD